MRCWNTSCRCLATDTDPPVHTSAEYSIYWLVHTYGSQSTELYHYTLHVTPCKRQLLWQESECLPVVSYLFGKGRHKEATERLVELLMVLNPDANRHIMLSSRRFDANGLLKVWDLRSCNIAELPESFGDILCTGSLDLNLNHLESLPLRFSNLSVGGNLGLSFTKLRCLPPNFDQIRVGGHLNLRGNPELTGIPAEFPNVKGWVIRP